MKILTLLFGGAIKTFQYFFPPHKEIQARYVLLFALWLSFVVYSGVLTYYVYARVWHNPTFPAQFALPSPAAPTVADNDRNINRFGPPAPRRTRTPN